MGNVFHEIYGFLKSSEKELLIKKSGSTKNNNNEKIRSGQSYLYKKYGMESEVIHAVQNPHLRVCHGLYVRRLFAGRRSGRLPRGYLL